MPEWGRSGCGPDSGAPIALVGESHEGGPTVLTGPMQLQAAIARQLPASAWGVRAADLKPFTCSAAGTWRASWRPRLA